MAIPTLPPTPDIPHVLLFGHSGAGKSALLGALLKAAETQGATLRGEVRETTGRMATIRDAVYRGDDLEPTAGEITGYTVSLNPKADANGAGTDPITIMLNDCSGTAAESLISNPEALQDPSARAPVTRAVIEADAIVLMVDGSSTDEELLEAFEEFDTFLTIVAQGKADARQVGGYPVLLVLTQCDRLAKPGDTLDLWQQRVSKRADEAWAKFDRFLKAADDEGIVSPFLPFGGIDLTVYAVAVRYPKLTDVRAHPGVPYQVAELFRDCFTLARSQRDRVNASNRRLRWTVRLVLGFIGFLFLSALSIALFQPPPGGPQLAERIRGYQQHEPEADVRLAYPYLARNKSQLTSFHEDSAFGGLPDDLRVFVNGRLKEIEDYEKYRSKLVVAQAPGDVRSLEELDRVTQSLAKGELALPESYSWGKTLAAELRRKWLADAEAIRKAEDEFQKKYREDYNRRGINLTLRRSLGEEWRSEVRTLLDEASRPPAPLEEPVPGSPKLEQPRGEAVINRVPYEFERVYNARKDWEAIRSRLIHLRDLGDALGLTAGEGRPEPVLVLPEPGKGVDSASLPGARLTGLLRGYPTESADFREWELRNFLDPARTLLGERLDRCFRTGVRHVHGLIREQMGPNPEQKDTPEWWRSFADVLGDPATPFPDWGRLLHLIARLRDPAAPNPVSELAAFLRCDKFELNLQEFNLLLEKDPALGKVSPTGPFVLTLTPRGGTAVTRNFQQTGGPLGSETFRFKVEGDAKLTYRPGDELRAEVPVRAGGQDFKLVWETSRTQTYQFDRLAQKPKLVKPGGGSEVASGVRLTPATDSTLPQLPVLFPDVRR